MRVALGTIAASILAYGCGGAIGPSSEAVFVDDDPPEVTETSPLALVFEEASDTYGVPVDLLKALAYDQTGLEPAIGEVEFDDQAQPWGYFGLQGDELKRAAELSGHSVEEIIGDDEAGIEAGAALLDAYAKDAGIAAADRANIEAWVPALEKFGRLDEEMAKEVARDVLGHLAEGVLVPMNDGTTMLIPRYKISFLHPEESGSPNIGIRSDGLGQSGALWRPSPNWSSRYGNRVELVVIHSCEGTYTSCVSWLRNTAAQASAHYVVKESGGEISQLVDENHKAWHVAANYRPWLNGGKLAHKSGQGVNYFSVGIEHGGRASQTRWPASQIAASVSLVRGITARHHIPRDRYHIVSHGRLQPENRTDPGSHWPWTSYIAAIANGGSGGGSTSGGSSGGTSGGSSGGSSTTITVDNTTSGRFQASSSWSASTWASGRVGSNYRYRRAQGVSDTAEYKVNLATTGRYEVFARVPGNGYNNDQPYIIHHRGGTSIVHRNISARGATWVSLGTYDFAAGDAWRVEISCWTNGDGYIIADAVKLERR